MTTPEAPEVNLLRRTLHEVAASLDVADAPLPPEAQVGPGHRRSFGWRAPLAVAAAVVVLAAGVWAVVRSTDGADDSAPADDVTTDTGDTPRAGWLPDGMGPNPTEPRSTTGPPLDGAVVVSGPADNVAVGLTIGEGATNVETALSFVVPFVGAVTGDGEALLAAAAAPNQRTGAAWRPDVSLAITDTLLDPASWGDPRGAWNTTPVDLRWVPGLGDTRSVTYEGGRGGEMAGSDVELEAVAGTLPEPAVLATLLDDDAEVSVQGHRAWFVPEVFPRSGHAVLWQAAPGVVAVVTGRGVAEADVLRVAEESTWPAAVPADASAETATALVPGDRVALSGPEDWPTLCSARPGDPLLPGEVGGDTYSGAIGVTGIGDISYELLLWEDRVTAGGAERTGQCWRLSADLDRFRGGGEVVTQGWGPVTSLIPVVWTPEETVFFAAAQEDLMFLSDADVVTTPLRGRMDDGTRFTFLDVARDGRSEVTFEVRDGQGRAVATAGPLPLDQPG